MKNQFQSDEKGGNGYQNRKKQQNYRYVNFLKKRVISKFQMPLSLLTIYDCNHWTDNYFQNKAASSVCLYFGHTCCCFILWLQGTSTALWLDEWSWWAKTKIFSNQMNYQSVGYYIFPPSIRIYSKSTLNILWMLAVLKGCHTFTFFFHRQK